jgi:hypothetical protein
MAKSKKCGCSFATKALPVAAGAAVGAGAVWLLTRRTINPAGDVLTDFLGTTGTIATQTGTAVGREVALQLQQDPATQRAIGTAAGGEIARQARVPLLVLAGAGVVGAGALVYSALRR